jgi:hypothetical protein
MNQRISHQEVIAHSETIADYGGWECFHCCLCEIAQQTWQFSCEQKTVFWIAAPALRARNDR